VLILLFDGDMFAYNATARAEEEVDWGDGLHTIYSQESECFLNFDSDIKDVAIRTLEAMKYTGPYEIKIVFSSPEIFRKKLYPLYKANRIGKRKPLCYKDLVNWVNEKYSCATYDNLEADDTIGILATQPGSNTVIISKDKDFKTIPGKFFDYGKRILYDISEEEADKWHLYQTLIGDSCDNYPGCPGIGPKKAEVLLENPTWDMIEATFIKQKRTKEDALLMARISRILRYGEYDLKTGKVNLWTPKE